MPLKDEDEFKYRIEIVKNYCDTAKSYLQISTAALALPIFFTQTLLGKEAAEKGLGSHGLPWTLYASWVAFLASIAFSLLYQWLAIRMVWDQLHQANRTLKNSTEPGFRKTWWIPTFEWLNRSLLYGGMVNCFFVGSAFFVCFAAKRLAF